MNARCPFYETAPDADHSDRAHEEFLKGECLLVFHHGYAGGQRQGVAKTYDLPGRLVKVTPYRNDKTDGKVVEYCPGTEREKKVIPFRQGRAHELVLEYYEDGTRKHELPAQDDRFHGVEKEYDEKGQLVRTRYWLDDEVVTKEDYVKGQTK
jgi:antitoxin component YwqK of YwqJK toxin-antitoxin module